MKLPDPPFTYISGKPQVLGGTPALQHEADPVQVGLSRARQRPKSLGVFIVLLVLTVLGLTVSLLRSGT